jgi:RecA DNA recombination protein
MATVLPSLVQEVTTKTEPLPLPGKLSSLVAGLPRGCISEIIGQRSAGCAALVHSILAESIARGEICALVDWANSFDPAKALRNGVTLQQLLWVRCGRRMDRALKVADVLLHTGGFGVVVLDLYGIAPSTLRRIPLPWWYRFRRAIEHSPTILAIAGDQAVGGSCASCIIEIEHRRTRWSGSMQFPLFAGIDLQGSLRKPGRAASVLLCANLAG